MARPNGKDRGLIAPTESRKYWRITFVDQFGHERKEKAGIHKTGARELLEVRRSEVRLGTYLPPAQRKAKPVLLKDVLACCQHEMKGANRTQDRWEAMAALWLSALGNRPVSEISPALLERWKNEQSSSAPATINRKLSFLRRMFTLAVRDGFATSSPFLKVKTLQENNERVRFLTPEEEEALLKELPELGRKVIAIAIRTGLRREELFGLRREDVNAETGFVNIPRSKSGKARRVKLSPTALTTLQELLGGHSTKWVFPSKTKDTPLSGANFVRRIFVPAVERAKISDLHFHDLRHTFASRLVQRGVDLYRVKELMGHSNIKTTQRYAHLAPSHLEDAVNLLD